tara:strand:- start:2595 stop:3143 length:549 start_codon:yes stop_codon:yes gene_type:complete
MPGIIKLSDGSNTIGITVPNSISSDKTLTLPNSTGDLPVSVSSTYTCTITYDTDITETNASNFETINITAYYYQVGKLYHFWLPTVNRTTVSLSADFIIEKVSLPATSSSTNRTVNMVQGYNLQGRYASTDYHNGYAAAIVGNSSTTASTQFFGTQGSAGQGKLRVYGESGTCNISGWFIGA